MNIFQYFFPNKIVVDSFSGEIKNCQKQPILYFIFQMNVMKSGIHRTKGWRTLVRLSHMLEIYKEMLTIKNTHIKEIKGS